MRSPTVAPGRRKFTFILRILSRTTVSPTFLHFKKGNLQPPLTFQTHLVCFLTSLSPSYCSSSSYVHKCISAQLFMLCFVFNTPSCKSNAARHKAVRNPLPSNLSHRGSRIYGQVIAPETEAERESAETRHPLVFDAPPHFVSRFWTCSAPRADATDGTVWHPFLSTCPVTRSHSSGFSSLCPSSKKAPLLQPTFQNLLPKSKLVHIVKVWTLYQCHVSSLNNAAAGNSHRETQIDSRLFVTGVWWSLLQPGVGVKSSLPLTLQPCGLCAWQLPAL